MSLASFFKRIRGGPRSGGRVELPRDIPNVLLSGSPALPLLALLAGYGINVEPDRLDEECGVDGDTAGLGDLARVASAYGISAEEVIVPREHVLSGRLPVIAVLNDTGGVLRFHLLWRIDEGRVQHLDAQIGCSWLPREAIEAALHIHEMTVESTAVDAYLRSDAFVRPLGRRLITVGVSSEEATALIYQATRETSWFALAALDAATRHIAGKHVGDGPAALRSALGTAMREIGRPNRIPAEAFSVRPAPPGVRGEERVVLRGAVILELSPT